MRRNLDAHLASMIHWAHVSLWLSAPPPHNPSHALAILPFLHSTPKCPAHRIYPCFSMHRRPLKSAPSRGGGFRHHHGSLRSNDCFTGFMESYSSVNIRWKPAISLIGMHVPEWGGCYRCCSIRHIQEIGPRPRTRKREKSFLFFVIVLVGTISGKSLKLSPPDVIF